MSPSSTAVADRAKLAGRAAACYRELLDHGFSRPRDPSHDDEVALFEAVTFLAERDGLRVVLMYEPYWATYTPIFEIARKSDGSSYSPAIVEDEAAFRGYAESDWGETLKQARVGSALHANVVLRASRGQADHLARRCEPCP